MIRKIAVILAALVLSGCVKPLVTVSSISSPKEAGKKFIIVPADKGLWEKEQLFYSHLLMQAAESLKNKGYVLVNKNTDADQMVVLDYGRSGGVSSNKVVSLPQWGQTGVSSATTIGSANTNYDFYGNSASANTNYNATTIYNPTYGITGYNNINVTETYYTIAVSLESIDVKDLLLKDKVTSLWMTRAMMTGTEPDGMSDFKALINYMSQYIGTTLNEDIRVNLDPKAGF